ncbi:MAG: 50S ribosomal protein L11 methyltransferase [Desulfobacteraceae bacterium]|nr:50S ribosomal protein L11 methyltransferase [Desulfobacteraceae bacterium]MCF8094519.1 50S ribosomal protein L11 methyltransferase [Desulfobacteraceae bacterium]
MKWIKTRVMFEAEDQESAAEMIADIFHDLGLQGVIMESPEQNPALDWAGDALPAPEQNAVIGFFADDGRLKKNRAELEKRLSDLQSKGGIQYRIHSSGIDEQDWAESWKIHFHPVKISERIVVKPTWRQYDRQGEQIVIELDPGMAFGTGTHPTTAMCLRLMEQYMMQGLRVLDIGTGSGILLIAAEKLGASALCGIDSDPVAVSVAEQNLRLNGIKENLFKLKTGNLVESVSESFDMAIANILTTTIVPMIPEIPRVLATGGIFIASGILAENKMTVTSALHESKFKVLEIMEEDGWIGIAAKKL